MTNAPRFIIAALAASVCLNLLGCNVDEPATFEPRSGTWTYEEEAVVSNSCPDVIVFPPRSPTFTLDYDDGDEFQIELGDQDAVCEIDGTEFTCADYPLGSVDVPGFTATLSYAVRWEGEFSSDAIADGSEVIAVTCVGADCTASSCSRESTWTAEFVQ